MENYREQSYCEERRFKVIIDEGEMDQIHKWTLMKDNIETGGDLFGLWIDKHTAVVQFVLGPGKGCRRTSVSFYQDVDYLEEAGNYLTKDHGLCNIGQWHSHDRLSLSRPSGGDENTVWGNMPNLGLNRYIVFIGTITDNQRNPQANVNCFLFERSKGRKNPVLKGEFQIIKWQNSPFRLHGEILKAIKHGAEILNETKSFEAKKKSTQTSTLEMMGVIKGDQCIQVEKNQKNITCRKSQYPCTVIQANQYGSLMATPIFLYSLL